jgi:glycerol-3-phosphate dehydrogenase
MTDPVYDIAIVGGGINGAGIARDAAGRGLKVMLVEQGDIGSATSSNSTKLIHGGLRYLEHYEFRLVRHALAERERLLAIAPHIIWPLRFVLPHRKGLRPAWLLRLGLFIYDHLGGRKLLPPTKTIKLGSDPVGEPLSEVSKIGFEYSDCWVQDNRLVVLNARDAQLMGAEVRVGTRFLSARRDKGIWVAQLVDVESGQETSIRCRAIVNAAGPWVDKVVEDVVGSGSTERVRLVQGSHIVVPKLYDHDRCYIFQNPDGRIFFAIPYEEDFTLIGTTDRDFSGSPEHVVASQEEVEYLVDAASSYFKQTISPREVVWTYSGVRALYDNGAANAQETTRDYVLSLDGGEGKAPILSVFGGKITTYRCLAEDVLEKLTTIFPDWGRRRGWTSTRPLPGGGFPVGAASSLASAISAEYPFLTEREVRRLVRHYGTEARSILGRARNRNDLGHAFGGFLTEAEVTFLMDQEYARFASDVVWRRTKSGLHMTADQIFRLDVWMGERRAVSAADAAQ